MSNLQKPEISRILNFAYGETIQIFGENFDKKTTKVYWWRENISEDKDRSLLLTPDKTVIPELPPEDALVYTPDEVCDNQILYVSATKNRIYEGTAVVWVENEAGISKPVLANRPEIWLKALKIARPGEIVGIYGNGFWHLSCRGAVLKNIKLGEFTEVIVKNTHELYYRHDMHRHSAFIEIPESLDVGEYEIYFHCGFGGALGWSEPVTIRVEKEYTLTEYYRTKWNKETSVEIPVPACAKKVVVAPDEGAFVDMADEIQSACDEMEKAGGGIVILTAGTYGISRTIHLRDGVVLQGAGKGATTIRTVYGTEIRQDWDEVAFAGEPGSGKAIDWKQFWQKHRNGVLIRVHGNSGIDSMHLEINGAGIGVLIANEDNSVPVDGAFVNNCAIDSGRTNTFYNYSAFGSVSGGIIGTCNTEDLVVYNCDIVTFRPISLLPSRNDYAKIIGNRFENSPCQMDQTFFGAMRDSLFIENKFIGGRRGFMTQGGFARNWMYQNRVEDVNRACNAQEILMSEHGLTFWSGNAKSIGEDYISVEDTSKLIAIGRKPFDIPEIADVDRFLCIIDGRGLGQYRKVIAVEGNKIILEKAWDVMPDESTYFTLVDATWHNLYVDNGSSFSNGHTQFFYLGAIENVISGHNIDLAAGIRIHNDIRRKEYETTTVLAFNYIVHCQVKASGKGLWLESDRVGHDKHPSILRTLGLFGNVVRGNVFDGMGSLHYTKNLPNYEDLVPHCGVAVNGAYNCFTNNRIGGYKTAVKLLDHHSKCNFFDKNTYDNVGVRFGGASAPIGPDAVVKD